MAASALLLAGCSSQPPEAPSTPDPAQAIARSIGIIRSATPEQPRVLKILFYGQSISTPKWTDQAVAALRAKYPNVTFDVRNLALGGWAAQLLERAAQRDIDDFYPDLIVFHVYGDKLAYERIIQTFRARTAADIIVQTDHVVEPVEPLCDEGVQLRWSPPPGCTGHIRFKQHVWEDYMSGRWIPTMAQKYGLAVEPRRQRWDAYLKAHHLAPMTLIADAPHPNARGWALMANLFTSWFEGVVDHAGNVRPSDPDAVRSLPAPMPGATKTYSFEGNRIELLASGPLDGKVKVTIDGRAPEDLDGCWQDSRVSRLPNLPDWPALKQVSVAASYHKVDIWTLRLTHIDAAQDKFDFTLTSALNGPDGAGKADAAFSSPSGVVSIQPDDWTLAYARQVARKGVAEGTTLQWRRQFVCSDRPPVVLANGMIEQRHLIATGLANGRHVVDLTVDADAPAISEVRAYQPPWK